MKDAEAKRENSNWVNSDVNEWKLNVELFPQHWKVISL